MPSLEAQIPTDKASRYLTQFCRHAAAMGSRPHTPRAHLHGNTPAGPEVTAEWSATEGRVTFGAWGRCTLTADPEALTLTISATDETGLHQIRDIVTRDFERFLHRTPTPVVWYRRDPPHETTDVTENEVPAPQEGTGRPGHTGRRWPRRRTLLLAVAALAIVGLHLGLAGTLVARSPWTGRAINLLLVLVALKVALVAVARMSYRRARTARTGGGER